MKLPAVSAAIALLFGLAFVLLLAVQTSSFAESVYAPDEALKATLMLAALATGSLAGLMAMRSRSSMRQLTLAAMSVLPLFLALTVAVPARALDKKAPARFITSAGPFAHDAILVSHPSLFNALCWTLKRGDVYLFGQSEVHYGMTYPESRHRELDDAGLERLLGESYGRRAIVFLTKADRERELSGILPARGRRAQQGDLVLWYFDESPKPDG